MSDKKLVADKVREKEGELRDYISALRRDRVLRALFPEEYTYVSNVLGGPTTPPSEDWYNDKRYVKKLLVHYQVYERGLSKEVRAEKHDHHGLHLLIEQLIVLIRELL